MKFIGKEEQKRIELQIQSLQAELLGLQTQLQTVELSAAQAQQEASAASSAIQARLTAAIQSDADSKAQLEAIKKQLANKTNELISAQDAAKSQLDAANKALADKAIELASKNKELASAQAVITKTKQDGDAALKDITAQLATANKKLADAQAQLDTKSKELAASSVELTAAQTASHASKTEAAKAKQEADAALAIAKADAAKAKQDADAAKSQATKAYADAQVKLDAQSKELSALKSECDKQSKLAQQTEAKYQDGVKENELLLLQLMQAQEELVEYYEQKSELEVALGKTKAETAKAKQEADAALATAKAETSKAKAEITKAKQEAEAVLATAKAETAKAKQEADASLAIAKAETAKAKQEADAALATAKAETAKAKQEADAVKAQATKASADVQAKLDGQGKELTALKAERDKQAKLAQQTEAKYQDSAQENELLLLQLMQAQEELVEYYEQKGEFEKLYQAYKARWERLENRLPNYLDFGAIEIVDVDGVSDVPSITWQVKDFAQAGVALSEFSFVTVLQDGHPGIGLVKDGQPHAFVPKLLGTHKDHLATFLGLGTTEFKQLTAAASILDQLEAGQWKGFEFPAQFDLSFWRPSIQTLLAQLKLLPALLRYDEVRLKRELINPDYEHLWLEFRGLSLGAAQWKKFEIRLGAALVQTDGFSQYPKFEIPLIDGKTKPFDSWYAESQDDSGAKLELRFALDKNVFDVAVWSKLTDADKALVLRVIYAMPEALKRLEKQKAAIHRPWTTWIDFATAAVKVIEVNKAGAKLAAEPAQSVASAEAGVEPNDPKAMPAPTAQTRLQAPTKLTSTGAKAGKVISITSKPVAKTVAKPKAKPPAKPIAKKPLMGKPKKVVSIEEMNKAIAERGASAK